MNAFGNFGPVPPLRRLKWLSTLIASVATAVASGIAIHWAFGGEGYHWSALPVALGATVISLAARHAIALKLDDKRMDATD